jgi:hypothetical protein
MKAGDITRYRLHSQRIIKPGCKNAGEVVSWMGALQAQDYAGSKWSIGLRVPGSTDAMIEQAVADKSIVRSWSLRGTLHWMLAADIRWMVALAAPNIQAKYTTNFKREGLDQAIFKKSNRIITNALSDGQALTRDELAVIVKKKGITTSNHGMGYLLLYASLDGIICFGPRRDKQFTHVLLDDWIPASQREQPDRPLVTLALRYFISRGPATVKDFAWWAGVTLTVARKAVEVIKGQLTETVVAGISYLMDDDTPSSNSKPGVYLLPGFDEYLMSYADRSAMVEAADAPDIKGAGNGLLSSTIILNGQVAGTWKRTVEKKQVVIETSYFHKASQAVQQQVKATAKRYAQYLAMEAVV